MEEITTTEQKKQLKTWAQKRDAILFEISNLNIKKEKLTKSNKEISISNSEINDKINKSIGRISELKKNEKKSSHLVELETLNIILKKEKLESSVAILNNEISELENKKKLLVENIKILNDNKIIKEDGIKLIDKISNNIVTINNENLNKFNSYSSVLIKRIKELTELSTKNIDKHNIILDKIPSLFVELQRKSIDREVLKKTKHI